MTFSFRYSFFPDESEIILSPNARFFVSKEVSLQVHSVVTVASAAALFDILQADGYYYVDLIEKRGDGVIF